MAKRGGKSASGTRWVYPLEFKEEAVQMLLDGHSTSSVCDRLGLSGTTLLYRWKKQFLGTEGSVASSLDSCVRESEAELRQVQRERDVLKKALAIFSRVV
jgi:transposase